MSKGFDTFVLVKVDRPLGCLNKAVKKYKKATERRTSTPNLGGFRALRLAVRAKLWFMRSLGQVNSVLDKCKPHGQEFVFSFVFF